MFGCFNPNKLKLNHHNLGYHHIYLLQGYHNSPHPNNQPLQVLRIVDGFADDAADEVEEVQVVSCDIGPGDRRFFMVVLMAKYGKITEDWILLGF